MREGVNIKFCEDCRLRFSLHAPAIRKKIFCPGCGETVAVVEYRNDVHGSPINRHVRPWTVKEMALLRKCVKDHKTAQEAGELLNRTTGGVKKMANRYGLQFVHVNHRRKKGLS